MSAEFYFNGIDATTGDYLLQPKSLEEIAAVARGERIDRKDPHQLELQRRRAASKVGDKHLGVKEGVDAKDLSQAGWGVIFPDDIDPDIPDALGELLAWRREAASQKDERFYREIRGPKGYHPGETKPAFLDRLGVGPGPADPVKMPYYLLIVGDPQKIPFRFQTQLDVQYAVGRIRFDTAEEYAQYAHSVVAAEKAQMALPPRAAFFGVANPDDRSTQLSASELVAPLAEAVGKDKPGWTVEAVVGEGATKARLADLLGGLQTPALLFTASHGLGFPADDPHQRQLQGALLCGDWPGPRRQREPVKEEQYLCGDDLGEEARLSGLLAFFFACYGAGTPRLDEYARQAFAKERDTIASQAFLAHLPQRMLAHPKGGALAVVGHVDRAWGYSFTWGQSGRQLAVFESTLKRLMEGHPVGSALEFFNERYAELSSDLSVLLENISFGEPYNQLDLAGMWTANNDARNYMILGDPAVRLQIATGGAPAAEHPSVFLASSPEPAGERKGTTAPSVKSEQQTNLPVPEIQPAGEVNQGSTASFSQPAVESHPKEELNTSFQELASRLVRILSKVLDEDAGVEVATYVTPDLDSARFEAGQLQGARQVALTRLPPSGGAQLVVPAGAEVLDSTLWKAHLDLVQLVQSNQLELLRLAVSAVVELGEKK